MSVERFHTVGRSAAAGSLPISAPVPFVGLFLLVLLSLLAILGLLLTQR